MRTHTAQWDAAVMQPYRVAVSCAVLFNRQPVASAPALNVVSGKVSYDRGAAILARLDITLAEPLLVPVPVGPLTPFGYELFVKRGITYPTGVTELMPLGVFPIQTSEADGTSLTTHISAMDRAQFAIDARFEDDYSIAAGVNYATAIQTLIANGVSGLTYWMAVTPYTTPLLVFAAQSDRWQAAQGMAKSIGCELFFNGLGEVMLRPEPVFTNPIWTISEGPGGVLVDANSKLDRGPAYNRVIAGGQNATVGFVPRGVWTDTVVSSPTNYYSGFGHKPRFYSSPFITTNEQAAQAAAAIGVAGSGVGHSLAFTAVPNPALEVGDPVLIKRTSLGINQTHLIDTLEIGLTSGDAMTGQSRAQDAG